MTVHVVELPASKFDGLQFRDCKLKVCGAVTLRMPPVPLIGIPLPDDEAPSGFTTEIVELVAVAETVTLIMATTPFAITFVLAPASRHLYDPLLPLQAIDLPAALAAGPIEAVIARILEAG